MSKEWPGQYLDCPGAVILLHAPLFGKVMKVTKYTTPTGVSSNHAATPVPN